MIMIVLSNIMIHLHVLLGEIILTFIRHLDTLIALPNTLRLTVRRFPSWPFLWKVILNRAKLLLLQASV